MSVRVKEIDRFGARGPREEDGEEEGGREGRRVERAGERDGGLPGREEGIGWGPICAARREGGKGAWEIRSMVGCFWTATREKEGEERKLVSPF